jgi:hypothetical protein
MGQAAKLRKGRITSLVWKASTFASMASTVMPSASSSPHACHCACAQAPPFSFFSALSRPTSGSSTPAKMSEELVRISGQL